MKQEQEQEHNKCKQKSNKYCKEETKQGYDKKMYPKLVLNKLKVMGNSTSIYTL
jgi:hypothetical protein